MKTIFFIFVLIFSGATLALDLETAKKVELTDIARLEGLRTDCLVKNSGNQRLCHRKVLKQCRNSMQKRECLSLMSKMQKSKMPKTNAPRSL